MPLKVLVIDNNAAEATLVNRTLGAEGYEVATATSLSEGLSLFADGSVDLLLISADTPAEEVAAWRSNAPQTVADVPLILLGEADPAVQASATVTTPIDTGHLIATVRAQVGSPVATAAVGSMNWLPDALRDSNAEMAQVERLLGWRAATDGAEDQDPVSLGIFSHTEADSSPPEALSPEVVTADSTPADLAAATDGITLPDAVTDVTLDGTTESNHWAPDQLDSLTLPEAVAEDPIPEPDDPMAAVEGLQIDTQEDDTEAALTVPQATHAEPLDVKAAIEEVAPADEAPVPTLADAPPSTPITEPEADSGQPLDAAPSLADEISVADTVTEVTQDSTEGTPDGIPQAPVADLRLDAAEAVLANADATADTTTDADSQGTTQDSVEALAASPVDDAVEDTTEDAFASLNLDDIQEDVTATTSPDAEPTLSGSTDLQQPPSQSATDGDVSDVFEIPAAVSGSTGDPSVDSEFLDELDAAFSAFDSPIDSASAVDLDEAEADEVIAEDLIADDLIPEASHATAHAAPHAAAHANDRVIDQIDDAVTDVMSEIIPELADKASAEADENTVHAIADDVIADITANTDALADSPAVAAAKHVFGSNSDDAVHDTTADDITEPMADAPSPVDDEVQDFMDSLSGLLDDDDDVLAAPTPPDAPTVMATVAAEDLPEAAVQDEAEPTDILAAAGVEEDGTVPLSTTPPVTEKLGIGPPLVTKVMRDETLPDDIAGLPMEKIERIIADVAREVVERVVWETVPALVAKALSDSQEEQDKMFSQIVEKAVWETIPALAETRVTAEIQRLSED